MKKVFVIGAGFWIAAAAAVAIFVSPSSTLRHVSFIYLVWFYAAVVNWVFIGIMLAPCALTFKEVAGRDAKVRHAIYLGMASRWFWIGFWVSGVAWVVNTFVPLALLVVLPLWTVVTVMALNVALSLGAIPLRIWIWRIYAQDEVPVA